MYRTFNDTTIQRFQQFFNNNSGWKIPLIYGQIRNTEHSSYYRDTSLDHSDTSITIEWTGFGMGTQTETFDWSYDITSEESSKEKLRYAKRVLMMMALKVMMDKPDDYSPNDWNVVLGIND